MAIETKNLGNRHQTGSGPKRKRKHCAWCGKVLHPKVADLKRGWGKFCSKKCKARSQWEHQDLSLSELHELALQDAVGDF